MAAKRFSIAGVVFNDDAPAEVVAKPKKKAAAKTKAPKPEAEITEVVEQGATEETEDAASDLI
jgi:hypothetical protein